MEQKRKLNILLIEDNESDAFLCIRYLEKSGFDVSYQLVDSSDEIKTALSTKKFDIILSDSHLPNLNAQNILEIYKSMHLKTPFILITGDLDEDAQKEMLKIGIHDYVLKNNLDKLSSLVEHALIKKMQTDL